MSAPQIEWIHIEWMDGRELDLRCSRTFVAEGVLNVYGYEEYNDTDMHYPMFGNIRVWHKIPPPASLPDGVAVHRMRTEFR